MNTQHSNFGLGYRLTSAAFKLGRFTVSELQKLTGAGENTVYSFIHRLENAGEGLLESAPVASLSPRPGAPRKQYWLTKVGANYLAKMSFEKAAQFGVSETEGERQAEGSASASAQGGQWTPVVHIYEQESALVITAELPGMAEDDVKVEVTSNVLTICGESQPSEANMHNKVQLKEWRSSFVLPAGTDPEQIHAEYSSGILTVTARKPPQVSLEAHRQSEPLPRAARKMVTGYGLQLREKQKTKRIYFTLENQFRNYFEKAAHKPGVTGELLLQQLERRLDNVVYRLGFAISRGQARQLVRHGHVEVNGRRVNIPSYQVSAGDEIQVREKARKFVTVEGAREYSSRQPVVNWLAVDRDNFKGRVLSLPKREDTGNTVPQWNVSKREETSG